MNLGYCCISLGINLNKKKSEYVTVNRGMTKKTFELNGLNYVSNLAMYNLIDTLKVLKYNVDHGIKNYRLSSCIFPWMTHYKFADLPNFDEIQSILINIGNYIKNNQLRVSFHASPYCVIASENPKVVDLSIDELNKYSEIFDLMQLEQSTYYSINVHVNTTRPSIEVAASRFCKIFIKLSESTRRRLTVENDDKESQYSVKNLYDLVHLDIGIPIVFDQLHYALGRQDQSIKESLQMALTTWNTRPLTHMSSTIHYENKSANKRAHADYIYNPIIKFDFDFDVDIEAKAKDLAVFKYIKEFLI